LNLSSGHPLSPPELLVLRSLCRYDCCQVEGDTTSSHRLKLMRVVWWNRLISVLLKEKRYPSFTVSSQHIYRSSRHAKNVHLFLHVRLPVTMTTLWEIENCTCIERRVLRIKALLLSLMDVTPLVLCLSLRTRRIFL
jgi:hypothetical protein